MKQLIISFFAVLMVGWTCVKDQTLSERNNDCTMVTVTQQGLGCDRWGVQVDETIYPAFDLPDQFKREGLVICIVYELVEDLRECPAPCCGGIWARILSIE